MISAVFLALGLVSALSFPSAAAEVKKGVVTGRIMSKDGGAMAGGMVLFFNKINEPPPDMTKYTSVPDERFFLDNNGRFTAEVPSGLYYIVGLKKLFFEHGPLRDGDLLFMGREENGKPRVYAVKSGEKLDIGVLSDGVPYDKAGRAKEGSTAIEGVVLDEEGRPAEGAVVVARADIGAGRPTFMADETTGKDGKYLIRVHQGGKYYLWVMSKDDDRDWLVNPALAVVKTGTILQGIDIIAKRPPTRVPKTHD